MLHHRHRNGNGKVYGDIADVSRDTLLESGSAVYGNSSIAESQIYAVSAIHDSTLCDAIVQWSYIERGIIYKAQLTDCLVIDSTVRACEGKSPVLNGTRLRRVAVEGDVWLGRWILDGPYHIREGVWTRAPRTLHLTHESGIDVGLTEGWNGRAFIACNERPVAEWLKHGIRIGLKLGWPLELAQQAHRFMEELADVKEIAA